MEDYGAVQPRAGGAARWAAALRAAVAVARRGASSEADLLRAVTDELRRIELIGGVTLMGHDGKLEVRNQTIGPAVEAVLTRLTGKQVTGYRFDPQQVDIYSQALSSGEPVFSADRESIIRQMMPRMLRPLLPKILSILGGNRPTIVAPLILGDRRLGTINFSADWLTSEDVPMVGALADQVAIALDHIRALEDMQAALERERLRNELAEAVASAVELPVVLELVVKRGIELVGAQAGGIALIEPDGETLTYQYLYGIPEELRNSTAPRGQGLTWRLVETGEPMLIDDYSDQPDALPAWVDAGVRAVLGVPMTADGETIGAIGFFSTDPERTFDPESAELLQSLANMAAIAVKNARLYAQTLERAEESHALVRTAQSISASLDLDTVLNAIATQARELLRADGSRIHLLSPEDDKLRCLVADDPQAEAILKVDLRYGEGLVGQVAADGVPLLANDPARNPQSMHIPGTPEDEPECLAIAPLIARQRTIGVMTVRRLGRDRPFTKANLNLLSALAAQAAVAIENADLYGQIESQAVRLEREVEARTRDLALSEARYRALVETSLAGIFQTDLEGCLVYVNQACAELVERPRDSLLGQPLLHLWAPEQRSLAKERFEARLQGQRAPREVSEVTVLTSGGQRLSALLAVSLITDDNGVVQGETGLILDISRRKMLESALRSERDRLNAILMNIADAVMVTDAEGNIQYVNPAWEQLTGYTSAEAIVENPSFLREGSHPPNLEDELQGAIADRRPWRGDMINARRDGSLYDAAVSVTPVVDNEGEVVNFVSIQHDISALKEVDRLKSRFVSDVSHELRTPLTNIRLYVDLLGMTDDQPRSKRYLETLAREGERLTHLIDDLLSLSRLDAGESAFMTRPVDVNRLLHALVQDRKSLASERGLHLSLEGDPELPHAMADERMLGRVFTNLLTNAMNYTADGGEIRLRTCRKVNEHREWITAEVEDTGVGIHAEELPLIFDRFFRGEASHSIGSPGTGLGLAICREIMDRHEGRITVESEPGVGSCFTVWLPVPHRS